MPRKKRKRRLVRPPPGLLFSAFMRYHFAQCDLDLRLHQLHRNGTVVGIEPKVFDVLTYLLQHRDRMVSKDELLDKLWPGQVVSETTLTRCITSVRKAVGDDGTKQEIIATHHGRGYRFVASVTELVAVAPVSPFSDGSSSVVHVTTNGQSSEALIEPLPPPIQQVTNEHARSVTPLLIEESQNATVKAQKPVLS
ncbi:MAG: transcriptional regulator, partial [Deltaproteobacteria bacterium]|nr:transcriptional regulator [Deltaproteobacteria bacterium]